MKKVDKIVTKYEAIDGILFDKESDALLHEGFLNGSVKKCDRYEEYLISLRRYNRTCAL